MSPEEMRSAGDSVLHHIGVNPSRYAHLQLVEQAAYDALDSLNFLINLRHFLMDHEAALYDCEDGICKRELSIANRLETLLRD